MTRQVSILSDPPDPRALMLAQIERGELVTALSRQQLLELEADLLRIVGDAEETAAKLRTFSGPDAHGLPAHLLVMATMGTGYLRHCRDAIRALHRARRKKP